ncbi:PAS domain S-box protein [Pantanalinema rosaneae CENA516]|uniref:PAS domain S-box protein n=1 Tax=Pantanalinema rosaneae TaxID=1620701 RepID=UPI003D6F3B5A
MLSQLDMFTILVIDRQPQHRQSLQDSLSRAGYTVLAASDLDGAIALIHPSLPDLILLDERTIPQNRDLSPFLQDCQTPAIPILLMVESEAGQPQSDVDYAIADWITKPCCQTKVLHRVHLQLQLRQLQATNLRLTNQISQLEQEVKQQTQALQQAQYAHQRTTSAWQNCRANLIDLCQHQEYFQQLTENIESVFWMTDPEKQQMLYVSPAYERIWGLSLAEVYRSPRSWLNAIYPEDRDRILQAFPKQSCGEYDEEYRIMHPDGSIRWIHDRAFPIRDSAGKIYRIAGIAEDITDYKQIQEKLGLQERAIAGSRNGIVIVDARLPDSPTIYVNPAFEQITGYTATEVIGHNCRFLQGPETEQPELHKLRTALKHGSADTVVLRNYRKDGTLFWNELSISPIYDLQGNLTHFVGIQNDITERQQVEQFLKQQLAAIEAAIDGIAILDAAGRYVYLNSAHVQLFGYEQPTELLGKTWQQLYYPEEIVYFQQKVFPSLGQNSHWQGEATAKRQDGSTFAEEVSLTLIEGGRMVCVCRDISDRKRSEAQLKASLQEKEILLKEIHHRVKNNLLVVSSLLEWQTDYVDDPAILKMLGESQTRIQSMALIHEKLYRSENLAKIDFSEYLETLARQLFFTFDLDDDQVHLQFELEPIFLNIETATPCGLIVSELISNVFEHAFPLDKTGTVCLKVTQNQQRQITITIQDNGVGFPAELDFRHTESLGLQLVCLLTQQLEGSIQIDRAHGTAFCLTFTELHYCNRI